jgi:hypothetical protein
MLSSERLFLDESDLLKTEETSYTALADGSILVSEQNKADS